MAEVIASISLISSIASLIEIGCKVVDRLHVYHSSNHNVPETYRHIESQVSIVIDGLRRTEQHAKSSSMNSQTEETLLATLKGCKERVTRPLAILDEVLPNRNDSSLTKARKAARSLLNDKQIQLLLEDINRYLTTLTFYNTSGLAVTPGQTFVAKQVNMAPSSRDPNFVDRHVIFTAIMSTIGKHGRAALAGLGGTGKTQIAVEFCYRHLDSHSSSQVLWMHAASASKVHQSCRAIAQKLELPGWNDPQVDVIRVLRDWIEDTQNDQWLLVVDSIDDLSVLEEPLPSKIGPQNLFQLLHGRKSGLILLTTRDRRIGERLAIRGHTISVPAMSLLEGKQLLSTCLDSTHNYSLDEVEQLMLALDYLPLAITQAAAYMTEKFISLQDYLSLLNDDIEETQVLLNESLSDGRREYLDSNSVIKTWKISFDQIRKQDARAADVLSLMAMFDRQCLQIELFKREEEPRTILVSSLATLQNFSLISRTTRGNAYRMHRLVHSAVQAWLSFQGTLAGWQQTALSILAEIFPSGEYETWSQCEAYLPHVAIALQHESHSNGSSIKRAELLKKVAWFDRRHDRYEVARAKAEEAAQIFGRIQGSEDPRCLSCTVTAADCMIELWQPREAEKILQATTATMNHVLGPEHPETLRSMGNRAWACHRYGNFVKANDLLYTMMGLRDAALGPHHSATLLSVNNFAVNLSTLKGRRWKKHNEQATKLFRMVLERREAELGPSHPDTLETYGNLAGCLDKLGEYSEAEALYRQVLALREKAFGIEGPAPLVELNNLAVCLSDQGKREDALAILRVSLALRIKVFGHDHIETFLSRVNLMDELVHLGYEEEAMEQCLLVLASSEKIINSQRPGAINLVKKAEWHLQHLKAQRNSLEDICLSGSWLATC